MEEDKGDPGPECVLCAAALRPHRGAAATAASTTKRAAEPGGGTHTSHEALDRLGGSRLWCGRERVSVAIRKLVYACKQHTAQLSKHRKWYRNEDTQNLVLLVFRGFFTLNTKSGWGHYIPHQNADIWQLSNRDLDVERNISWWAEEIDITHITLLFVCKEIYMFICVFKQHIFVPEPF